MHGDPMIQRNRIQAYVDQVVRHFHPERVVLFGSHAYGRPDGESDVDLLVIMRHRGAGAQQAALIRQRVRAGFPLDLIVRSPANVRQRLKMGDSFIREILSKGRVLHEAVRT
jgi:predicted nucleotidyltransferase